MQSDEVSCDVLVIGAGAGGLSAAIAARKAGLEVIVAEKASVFGGTTAFSGGVLWIPGNPHCPAAAQDTREQALRYLREEARDGYDAAAAEAFVDAAPQMVRWFERETCVQFVPTLYPDYHPTVPGGVDVGRSILAKPFDIRELGADMARLRPPLETITFIGMMFNSSNADLKHFFRFTRSWPSFVYVVKRLALHLTELLRHGRAVQVTSGNALAARLAKAALDLGIPIWTEAPARGLIQQDASAPGNASATGTTKHATNEPDTGSAPGSTPGSVIGSAPGSVRELAPGQVTGAVIERDGRRITVQARRGVVLACGGFAHDLARIRQAYPHLRRGGEHLSPVPADNTGDGIALGEQAGGRFEIRYANAAAWMPVSKVPRGDGSHVAFPHLLDRYKPGVIGVNRRGLRFCNESESYHDVGAAMIEACRDEADTAMWLVCDHATLSKYGLGIVKPAPMPVGRFLRNGYLLQGATLADLAHQAGIDAAGLEATVKTYNEGAVHGEDRQFGRGSTSFNRYLADPERKPNPCVAPIGRGPYYAVKLVMGDLGTFDGLSTTVQGQVLTRDGAPIPGLYAVGNDRASVMGGNYPGAGITLGPNMTFGWLTGRHLAGLAGLDDLQDLPASAERASIDRSTPNTTECPTTERPNPHDQEMRHAA
jgi:succinate dehydrogenase/fumarate reductase flavoprotein subunit